MTIPQHIRIAHEATDEVLISLDGLVCALDVIEDRLTLTDYQSRESKAFHIIRPLLSRGWHLGAYGSHLDALHRRGAR